MFRLLRQLIVLVLLILAARHAFTEGYVTEAGVRRVVDWAGPLAVPAFVLATAVTCLVLAPLALAVGTGALVFGATTGALYSWIGAVLGTLAAFALGRYVMPDLAPRLGQGRWIGRIRDWIEARIAAHALGFIMAAKLSFFANSAVSYAAGLTSVRVRDFALGSLVGCLPGVFMLSHACEAVVRADSTAALASHPAILGLVAVRLAGLGLLVALARAS